MLSDHCLSDLSVTLVYYGQTVGGIKIPLGTEVGHGRPSQLLLSSCIRLPRQIFITELHTVRSVAPRHRDRNVTHGLL